MSNKKEPTPDDIEWAKLMKERRETGAIKERNRAFARAFGFLDEIEWQQERCRLAAAIMQGYASNPNFRGTIAQMADWAHLGADILLGKLNQGVHVQATGPQTENDKKG